MPVQTLPQFKGATRLTAKGLRIGKLRDIRGNKIKPIDQALAAYDLVRTSSNLGKKSQALSALLAECSRWLKNKEAKVSTSTGNRRTAILQLANDAFAELKNINRASGTDFYNLNKAIKTGNQVNYQRKGLAGGYSNERALYVLGNKTQNPTAAGFVHSGMDNLPHVGVSNNFAQRDEAQLLLQKGFSALTPYEFDLIGRAYGTGSGGPVQVQFSDKATRSTHLMVVYQGYNHDFETVSGQAYDTQTEPNGYMYAMDEYGTLFASDPNGLAKGGRYWNHSSFNAGKDVVCAGMIKIHQGVLQFVDNQSGHYKPTRQHLFELLTIFQGEGISLVGVNVGITEPAPVVGYVDIHTVTALNFLGNINLLDPNPQRVQG